MAKLICSECKKEFQEDFTGYSCECGGILDLEFEAGFPLDEIKKRKPDMWRYSEAIPLEDPENAVSFGEGFTPLLPMEFGGKEVWIKQDHLFQTGSYKDRGAAVMVSRAKETGITKVVEDSSGNAGCAVAAYCAKASIECSIFVPSSASSAKIAQILFYGATVEKIPGNREAAAKAVLGAAKGAYYASHVYNPYFLHGTKTFAYEISEQLGWRAPDTIVVPVGNGTLLLGAYIGFEDLRKAGIIEKTPRIIAIQAENCAPLAKRFEGRNGQIKETVAEGIAIPNPARGRQITDAVVKTGGKFMTVEEAEIINAMRKTAKRGHYIEPTASATVAGLERYAKEAPSGGTIVSVFTGHGLKYGEKTLNLLR